MSTPHNTAEKGDIAKTVLMPGDPLRAKYIAETFLTNVKCFNTVRNMFGYTGTYRGKEVSVMAHGMGIPSIGIYSYELYSFYDVDNIIRIGSAATIDPAINLFDICLAKFSFSLSNYAFSQSGCRNRKMLPNKELSQLLKKSAWAEKQKIYEVGFSSSDVFYYDKGSNEMEEIKKNNCSILEMETFGLFHNANVTGKKAAALCTISDDLINNKKLTSEERQLGFLNMIKVALGVVLL